MGKRLILVALSLKERLRWLNKKMLHEIITVLPEFLVPRSYIILLRGILSFGRARGAIVCGIVIPPETMISELLPKRC